MDAKLKLLKVVDLKSILASASVSVPAKATKSDLIARIQASKPALAAYAALYPTDDLLTPPEEIDWNADQSPPAPKPTTSNPSPPPPAPATTTPAPAVSPPVITSTPTVDPELEKRRQRAARFGIPLVEAPVKTTKSKPINSKPTNPSVDPKKLEERAARFGLKPEQAAPTAQNVKKRPSPQVQEVDPEELERRKKRAARFGIAVAFADAPHKALPLDHVIRLLHEHGRSLSSSTFLPTLFQAFTTLPPCGRSTTTLAMTDLDKKTTDMGWPEADALWLYTVLPEPQLTFELERLSLAKSVDDTDVVTFQPCPNYDERSQDRFVIQSWVLPNGTWSFRAVFDGHAGHETVDYAAENLPDLLKRKLTATLEKDPTPTPEVMSDLLTAGILSFDDGIGQALLDIFPSPGAVMAMSDEEIHKIVNDHGPNSEIVLRCMRGTTVLVALVDPTKSDIWVASLGDCMATLGTKDKTGKWTARVLSSAHNGENEIEANRVRNEHPGEPECILYDRVLGSIAVTRALGDFSFKLPAPYVERVFLKHTTSEFAMPEKIRAFIHRISTPPYVSGVPDVRHVNLASLGSTSSFLVMNSDGLTDLSDDRLKLEMLAQQWVSAVGKGYPGENQNLALKLLREGLGGKDEDKVSRMMTVEMSWKWMDDTTILVVRL